jgi:hypothetical protein
MAKILSLTIIAGALIASSFPVLAASRTSSMTGRASVSPGHRMLSDIPKMDRKGHARGEFEHSIRGASSFTRPHPH